MGVPAAATCTSSGLTWTRLCPPVPRSQRTFPTSRYCTPSSRAVCSGGSGRSGQADHALQALETHLALVTLRACGTRRASFALRTGSASLTLGALRAGRALRASSTGVALSAGSTVLATGAGSAGLTLGTGSTILTLGAGSTVLTFGALRPLRANGADQAGDAARGLALLADDAEASVASVQPADLDVVIGDLVTLGLDPEARSRDRAGLVLDVRSPCCGADDHEHQAERAEQREQSLERHSAFLFRPPGESG